MACPDMYTLRNLAGRFRTNRQLSDSSDPLLCMQGIGWAIRKLMGAVPIVITIKSSTAEGGIQVIDAENIIGGGIHRSKEHRTLDWTPVERVDANFGRLRVQNGWSPLSEIMDNFLKDGQEQEQSKDGVIRIKVESLDHGWIQEQTWGFEVVDGQRRYVRRIVVTKGDRRETARLVFDWEGLD